MWKRSLWKLRSCCKLCLLLKNVEPTESTLTLWAWTKGRSDLSRPKRRVGPFAEDCYGLGVGGADKREICTWLFAHCCRHGETHYLGTLHVLGLQNYSSNRNILTSTSHLDDSVDEPKLKSFGKWLQSSEQNIREQYIPLAFLFECQPEWLLSESYDCWVILTGGKVGIFLNDSCMHQKMAKITSRSVGWRMGKRWLRSKQTPPISSSIVRPHAERKKIL